MVCDKLPEILPAEFLNSCPEVVANVKPGAGFTTAFGMSAKLRRFGRVTDGRRLQLGLNDGRGQRTGHDIKC